ncbi:MAG: tetratricopeptide repeat protein [Woeseiaceae bacterium]|nr:tetratricopeptide repeat protein [Woeseiaceae bacterium]
MSFFEELKRRNVFRVAIAYLIAAWLVLQVTDIVVPILELPDAVSKAVLLFIAVGFVISVILAWAYELTPEGVKLEKDVVRSQSITHRTGRKLDFIIIAVLAIALTFFALDKFVWNTRTPPAEIASTAQQAIAVLPFVNMSANEDQEYFSDGLTEELLNLLARVPQLRVTSRSSAFYYKGKEFRIADVGRELGVGHILEGSVRRSGDTIRVTAQLINVAEDAHVWSNTWDRTLDDVFEIQDEIAQAVVDELRVRLVGDTPRAFSADPEAYSLYLRAKHIWTERTVANNRRAEEMLKNAIEIDPTFVAAWLEIGYVYFDSQGIGIRASEEAAELARDAAHNALRLDATNGQAHALLATVASAIEQDLATAISEIDIAMTLAPNNADVVRIAGFTKIRLGNFEEGLALYERAITLDPLGVGSWYSIGLGYMAAERLEEAEAAFRRAIELNPDGIGNHQRLATVLLLRGEHGAALEEIQSEPVEARRRQVRALIYQSMGDNERAQAEHEALIALGERWTYEIAQNYAYRGMIDEAFHWLDRAIARNDGSLWYLASDPFLDSIRDDPRFEAIERRLGIKPK